MAKQFEIYLAIGHGKSLDGSFDPGTVYDIDGNGKVTKDETEAALMLPIGKAAYKYLRRSGVKVYTDAFGSDGKTSADDNNMNMVKCIQRANSLGVDAYLSLHCDWYKAQSGTLPLYVSAEGKKMAECINKHVMKDMGMKTRGLSRRTDLGELNDTRMQSCIFECGSISKDVKKFKDADRYGKAIAKGICEHFGIPFVEMKVKAKGDLIVRKSSLLTSAKIKNLTKGKVYTIVETNSSGNRGKLSTGGWITITDKYVEKV